MSYTRQNFGKELLERLAATSDPVALARWAYSKYMEHLRELEPGLKALIMKLVVMEEGPEFELTKDQLDDFVRTLLESQ
jgi:hypothetical protein